jgi:hypothetical protein
MVEIRSGDAEKPKQITEAARRRLYQAMLKINLLSPLHLMLLVVHAVDCLWPFQIVRSLLADYCWPMVVWGACLVVDDGEC